MITESLIDLFLNIFSLLFGSLEFVQLPTQAMDALSTIFAYGTWIVGVDIMALFVTSVVFWWTVHMSIGVAVWVWGKLPLT